MSRISLVSLMKALSVEVCEGGDMAFFIHLSTCPCLVWANLASALALLWVVDVGRGRDHKPLHLTSLFEHKCKSMLTFLSLLKSQIPYGRRQQQTPLSSMIILVSLL